MRDPGVLSGDLCKSEFRKKIEESSSWCHGRQNVSAVPRLRLDRLNKDSDATFLSILVVS